MDIGDKIRYFLFKYFVVASQDPKIRNEISHHSVPSDQIYYKKFTCKKFIEIEGCNSFGKCNYYRRFLSKQ